jgi:uncharacterized protein
VLRVVVRVRPGARADDVGGRWDGARGPALLVAVRAHAVDGEANAAVAEVLAGAFGLKKAEVAVLSGHRSRDKTMLLYGDDDALGARLAELLAD